MRKLKFLMLFLFLSSCSVSAQPNVLVIITDDQSAGTMQAMPETQKEILSKGISFNNAYISNSTCCPSRAAIFTGLYAKNNGVPDNKHDLRVNTTGFYAKEKGYTVGIVGKYLNSHGLVFDKFVQDNFDYWAVNSKKRNAVINTNINGVDGSMGTMHSTQWVTRHAIDFLNQTTEPFLLYVTFHAPHGKVPVDPDFKNLYGDWKFEPPVTYNSALDGKPNWIKELNVRFDHKRKYIGALKKLQVVDVSIKAILDLLKQQNKLENTYIIFISDNGTHSGEFKLSGKWTPYTPAIHVPLAITGPNINSQLSNNLVANIDIAPTINSLMDAEQGTEGLDLLSTATRRYLYLDGGHRVAQDRPTQAPYYGIMTTRFKLIRTGKFYEFYDLKLDPHEQFNLFYTDKFNRKKRTMRRLLKRWQ